MVSLNSQMHHSCRISRSMSEMLKPGCHITVSTARVCDSTALLVNEIIVCVLVVALFAFIFMTMSVVALPFRQ